jgi:hypothetical protein
MDKTKLTKIAKGAGIAAGGALLTYLLGQLPNINFGSYTPLATAAFSILINAALKFLEQEKAQEEM